VNTARGALLLLVAVFALPAATIRGRIAPT
jgi:hypothetical protein